MMRAVVDLPEPLSPTMPSAAPGARVKPMPSTAMNSSRPQPRSERTWKLFRSPSTRSTGSAGAAAAVDSSSPGSDADSRRIV